MSNLLSRKFLITVLGLSMAFTLSLQGKLSVEAFMTTLMTLVGMYSTANVVQKFSDKKFSDK